MNTSPQRAPGTLRDRFNSVAMRLTSGAGSPFVLAAAFVLIIAWAVTGPFFGFSDTWQLVINTTTTIITFLMVFVIQASQNRDSKALHLKLDEIIRSHGGARNEMIGAEQSTEAEIARREQEFLEIAARSGAAAASANGTKGGRRASGQTVASTAAVRAVARKTARETVEAEQGSRSKPRPVRNGSRRSRDSG